MAEGFPTGAGGLLQGVTTGMQLANQRKQLIMQKRQQEFNQDMQKMNIHFNLLKEKGLDPEQKSNIVNNGIRPMVSKWYPDIDFPEVEFQQDDYSKLSEQYNAIINSNLPKDKKQKQLKSFLSKAAVAAGKFKEASDIAFNEKEKTFAGDRVLAENETRLYYKNVLKMSDELIERGFQDGTLSRQISIGSANVMRPQSGTNINLGGVGNGGNAEDVAGEFGF